MTDLRNKIKDIIDENVAYDYDGSVSGFDDAADAILEALPEIAEAQARIAELEAVVDWYGEQVYLYANDTTEKAAEADVALDQDGGKKARETLKETS